MTTLSKTIVEVSSYVAEIVLTINENEYYDMNNLAVRQ